MCVCGYFADKTGTCQLIATLPAGVPPGCANLDSTGKCAMCMRENQGVDIT
jgi:hypothetical protein